MDDPRGKWAKQTKEERLTALLGIIVEKQPINYSDLKSLVNVSDPSLSGYLKDLIERKQIEYFEKKDDRRGKWYQVRQDKIEQITTKLLKYEAIKFIENIEDPTYFREASKSNKVSATLFVPSIEGPLQKAWQINTKFMAKAWLKDWVKEAEEKKLKQILKAKPGLKVAVVLTAES